VRGIIPSEVLGYLESILQVLLLNAYTHALMCLCVYVLCMRDIIMYL
jgi:hypothetical protein